jgi:hypothetical protein
MEAQETQTVKAILNTKSKAGGSIQSDLKICYKTLAIKTA